MAHPSRHWSSRAFSLLEVLLVLAIVASVAGLGLAATRGARLLAESHRARVELAGIAAAIEAFRARHHAYPAASTPADLLSALTGQGSVATGLAVLEAPVLDSTGYRVASDATGAFLVDPWDQPYRYLRSEDGAGYRLYSSGPDGEPGDMAGTDAAAADDLYANR